MIGNFRCEMDEVSSSAFRWRMYPACSDQARNASAGSSKTRRTYRDPTVLSQRPAPRCPPFVVALRPPRYTVTFREGLIPTAGSVLSE